MKLKKLLSLFLAFSMLLTLPAFAASFSDFTDAGSHWAAADLQRAVEDGLLTGTSANKLSPDAPITTAQMLTILNRVLSAAQADASNAPADAWYAQEIGKAAHLGLIPAGVTNYDAPLARQDALSMLVRAFGLTPANQSAAPLSAFSDAGKVREANVMPVANLVSRGLVKGFDGALNANGSVTRAEFVTLLYRIAGSFTDAASLKSGAAAAVLKGDAALSGVDADRLVVDCAGENVSLHNCNITELTLRCEDLKSLSIDSTTTLGTLTLAVGAGSGFQLPTSAKIGTLRILSGPVSAVTAAQADGVELTGSGLSVAVSGAHRTLSVAGSGNSVTLAKDAELSALTVTGSGNSVTEQNGDAGSSVAVGDVSVWGSKNTVSATTTGGSAATVYLAGTGCSLHLVSAAGFTAATVDGSGSKLDMMPLSDSDVAGPVGTLTLAGSGNSARIWSESAIGDVKVSAYGSWLTLATTGAGSISVPGSYNTVVKARSGEVGAVTLAGPGNVFKEYVDNHAKSVTVNGAGSTVKLDGTADAVTVNGENATITGAGSTAKLTLNALGCKTDLHANVTDDSGAKKAQAEKEAAAAAELAKQQDESRVLALVTTGYKGNYTLSWAQNHDYTPLEKKAWVQAKGYSSATGWLIWVNLSMQRVNIFKGSQGNWDLIYSCIVGTGAPGTGTPVGLYTTTYKLAAGWTTSTYTVKPVVGFKNGTGYAFHSRLFYPGTTRLMDASIGYPISHGCVRMYDEDVAYIYNNIPVGTTVVVF